MRSGPTQPTEPYFTGPYHEPKRGHWRCVIYNREGQRSSCKALKEDECRSIAEEAVALLKNQQPLTLAKALTKYRAHLTDAKGASPERWRPP